MVEDPAFETAKMDSVMDSNTDSTFQLLYRKSFSSTVQQRCDAEKQANSGRTAGSVAEEWRSQHKVTTTGSGSSETVMAAPRHLPPSLKHHCSLAESGYSG